MNKDNCIVATSLTKNFGGHIAVDNLNLIVPTATIYGFLGPNGSGKSTTMRMLIGLLKPSSGQINVLNYQLPQQAEALREQTGYMTQQFSLYDNLTVEENLSFISKIFNLNRYDEKMRIKELLSIFRLTPLRKQLAATLSGGQQKCLALAATVLNHPKLVLLDEPTAGVDPETRRYFWEKLFELCEQGTTVLVSTHYMDEAERCHYLAILDHGELKTSGSPEKLINDLQASIVEISSPSLKEIKQILEKYNNSISICQHGRNLRIMLSNTMKEPLEWVQEKICNYNIEYKLDNATPNLEDVFIRHTKKVQPDETIA